MTNRAAGRARCGEPRASRCHLRRSFPRGSLASSSEVVQTHTNPHEDTSSHFTKRSPRARKFCRQQTRFTRDSSAREGAESRREGLRAHSTPLAFSKGKATPRPRNAPSKPLLTSETSLGSTTSSAPRLPRRKSLQAMLVFKLNPLPCQFVPPQLPESPCQAGKRRPWDRSVDAGSRRRAHPGQLPAFRARLSEQFPRRVAVGSSSC